MLVFFFFFFFFSSRRRHTRWTGDWSSDVCSSDLGAIAKPAGGASDRAIQLDHISFDVPDEHALEMLRKRLLAAGSEGTQGGEHGFIRSGDFTHPHGIPPEAPWGGVRRTGPPPPHKHPPPFP